MGLIRPNDKPLRRFNAVTVINVNYLITDNVIKEK